MGLLILGVNTVYIAFCFVRTLAMVGKGLKCLSHESLSFSCCLLSSCVPCISGSVANTIGNKTACSFERACLPFSVGFRLAYDP